MLLSSVARGGTGTVAQAVLLRQLANLAKALHDAHVAVGEAQTAERLAGVVRAQLVAVAADAAQAAAPVSPRPLTPVTGVNQTRRGCVRPAEGRQPAR